MIDILKTVAVRGQQFKAVPVAVGLASIVLLLYELFGEGDVVEEDFLLVPGILLLVWSLVLWILLLGFPGVPDIPDAGKGFLLRWKAKFVRFVYYFLALFFVIITAMALGISSKLLGVWLTEFM